MKKEIVLAALLIFAASLIGCDSPMTPRMMAELEAAADQIVTNIFNS